jgi:GH15 family glucan-1,4-alpha-glucosidase
VRGTVAAVERHLVVDGLVLRYTSASGVDHLPPGEGTFLPCTFWLVDNLALTDRYAEAEALFQRLLTLRNDVGLLSEEFDPAGNRMRGNFPQALTHMALINSARLLALPHHRAKRASERGERPATAEHTDEGGAPPIRERAKETS